MIFDLILRWKIPSTENLSWDSLKRAAVLCSTQAHIRHGYNWQSEIIFGFPLTSRSKIVAQEGKTHNMCTQQGSKNIYHSFYLLLWGWWLLILSLSTTATANKKVNKFGCTLRLSVGWKEFLDWGQFQAKRNNLANRSLLRNNGWRKSQLPKTQGGRKTFAGNMAWIWPSFLLLILKFLKAELHGFN